MIRADGPKSPSYPLALIHPLGPIFRHLPLSLRRHLLFLRAFGMWGNFRTPRTFREKAQWRTINDRRPRLSFVQDKLAAKEYTRQVSTLIGVPIRIPQTYWVGTDLLELQALAHKLPNRWVLKPNHSAGRYRLINGQLSATEWHDLVERCSPWVERDEEELVMGHWAYGEARHLLIAEERVGMNTHAPNDFKVSCFDGRPGYYFWANRSMSPTQYAFFTPNGERFIWGEQSEHSIGVDTGIVQPSKELREQMIHIASAVASPFDWMRVDFYVEDETLWFGELTLYGAGGLYEVSAENNDRFGALWRLPDLSVPDPREGEWRALLEGTPRGTLQE
jgi:TupA-like ATPgrasp